MRRTGITLPTPTATSKAVQQGLLSIETPSTPSTRAPKPVKKDSDKKKKKKSAGSPSPAKKNRASFRAEPKAAQTDLMTVPDGMPACLLPPPTRRGKYSYTCHDKSGESVVEILLRTKAFYIKKSGKVLPEHGIRTIYWNHYDSIDECWDYVASTIGWVDEAHGFNVCLLLLLYLLLYLQHLAGCRAVSPSSVASWSVFR